MYLSIYLFKFNHIIGHVLITSLKYVIMLYRSI